MWALPTLAGDGRCGDNHSLLAHGAHSVTQDQHAMEVYTVWRRMVKADLTQDQHAMEVYTVWRRMVKADLTQDQHAMEVYTVWRRMVKADLTQDQHCRSVYNVKKEAQTGGHHSASL